MKLLYILICAMIFTVLTGCGIDTAKSVAGPRKVEAIETVFMIVTDETEESEATGESDSNVASGAEFAYHPSN